MPLCRDACGPALAVACVGANGLCPRLPRLAECERCKKPLLAFSLPVRLSPKAVL